MGLNGRMAEPSMPNPNDPQFLEQLRQLLAQLGLNQADGDLTAMIQQVQQQFGNAGPFQVFTNADADPDAAWRTTITAAKHQLSEHGPDPKPTSDQSLAIADAGRLAEVWLDPHTTFAPLGLEAQAWTREAWLDATGDTWRALVEPIIAGSADALGEGIAAPEAPELAGLQQMFAPMLRTSAGMLYRDQLKRTLAKLASAVLTGTEPGVQLMGKPQVVVLPSAVASFVDGLEVPLSDMLLYLAVRESARQRLFASVGWLEPQLTALLSHYAREIRIDFEFIGNQLNLDDAEQLSLERIAEVGQSVSGSFFEPASTPTQLEILGRLETLLALVEGWVDEVTTRVTTQWLPNATTLIEAMRRRRAAGGPEQSVWQTLVGLELRPRRIRDAENLWAALTQGRGVAGRDSVWAHPDLVPTADDLDDPLRFVNGESSAQVPSDFDLELEKLLREGQ